MALSLEPEKVVDEVRANYRERDRHLDGVQLILDKYPGRWWSEGGVINPSTNLDSENSAFEYVSWAMTQGVWANPRWRCTTRRPRAQQMVAEAMQWGMNRWTQDSDLKTTLEDLFVDFCFSWGVGHVSAQPTPETYEAEDPILWPQLSRISPFDFAMDRCAPTPRRARILHHRYRIDKEDMIERARRDRELPPERREGWNIAAIRELQETTVAESWLTRSSNRARKGAPWAAGVDEPDREQIEVLEVYFPGHQIKGKPGPEDGFNGTLGTYGLPGGGDGAPVELRAPRPFFGPRWGPYTVIGCYVVPDCPWPLSLLAATAGQMEQANRIANAVDAQVASYKRLGLTNDPVLAQMVKDRPTDTIHVYRHALKLAEAFVEHETGGTTAPNVAAEQRVIARRDRIMGFSANQRGTTTGDTATDVTFANENAMGRQAYPRNRYQDGIRRVGKTVAWYLYHTDEIVMPLGMEAIEAFGLGEDEEAWFVGGDFADGSGMTFDDLGLELEPYSMERPSETMLARHGELISQVLQMAPAFPAIAQMGGDVKGILDAYGDAFGYPRLSKLFPGVDSVDLASMQPAEIEPKLQRDVGIAGLFKSFKAGAGAQSRGGAPQPQAFAGTAG